MGNTPAADFSFVRYANCWEDAGLLIAALEPAPGKRLLSIASAGDNSLSLIAGGAEVVAVDLNPSQLACAELRREGIRELSHEEFLLFSGVRPSHERLAVYRSLRSQLTVSARNYWDGHSEAIAAGLVHFGRFERYLKLFGKRVVPLIHNRRVVQRLLAPMSNSDRRAFYDGVWDNWRWRILFRIFFSRRIMGLLGRDPSFFQYVDRPVSELILARTRYALTELDPSKNPYLAYILTGNYGEVLPDYLVPENFERIKANIDLLVLRHGSVDEIARGFGPGSFDGFNLSDIFEYLSPDQSQRVYASLLESARPHARFAYWNMLVPRRCPVGLAERVVPLTDKAAELFMCDRAFFYQRFVLEEAK